MATIWNPDGKWNGHLTIETIDGARLLSLINGAILALEKYDAWIAKHGHRSIATAEILVNDLHVAVRDLSHEAAVRWNQWKESKWAESLVFGIIKSVREVCLNMYPRLPRDRSLYQDTDGRIEPLIIRLSADVKPVSFGALPLDQLQLARDRLEALMEAPKSPSGQKQIDPSDFNDLMTREEIAQAVGVRSAKTIANQKTLGKPAISGGGRGKKSLWHYLDVKPILEMKLSITLPDLASARQAISIAKESRK